MVLFQQILSSPEVELRAKIGPSRMKIAYLKDLAAHVADGRLNLNNLPAMTVEDVITQLTKVKGTGRWTGVLVERMFYQSPIWD